MLFSACPPARRGFYPFFLPPYARGLPRPSLYAWRKMFRRLEQIHLPVRTHIFRRSIVRKQWVFPLAALKDGFYLFFKGYQDLLCFIYPFLFTSTGATTLKFHGNNSMSLRYERGATNEADDLTLRFRSREQNGLLMSTRHDRSADRLEVTLEAGRVRVKVEMGQAEKSVYAGHSLNDDIYHTVVFRWNCKETSVFLAQSVVSLNLFCNLSYLRYSFILLLSDVVAPRSASRLTKTIPSLRKLWPALKVCTWDTPKYTSVV